MDCRILRHVTLKSDGHLGCDDSMGYGIDLGFVSNKPGWRLKDVFNSPVYRHVRRSFSNGSVPWPGVCEGCDLLSAGGHPIDTLDSHFELLVEPTLACSLSCACCLRKQIIAKGRDTSMMDPEILKRLIMSARNDNLLIDQVHYIGWGEPLLHPDFRLMVDTVYESFPQTIQMVTTTGNVEFVDTIGTGRFDRIVCSCDGITEGSYAKYRKGGTFAAASKFMSDAKKIGHKETFLEWKYILFEFNDSDEEILEAQRIADDIGVDSLLFIITNSKWHSKRFSVANPHDVPIRSLIASVSPAAAMNAIASSGVLRNIQAPGFLGHIDKCTISEGKFLNIHGWLLNPSGGYVPHAELVLDGAVKAKTRVSQKRVDVVEVHKHAVGPNCGFMFSVPVDPSWPPTTILVRDAADHRYCFEADIAWNTASPVKRRTDFALTSVSEQPRL